MRVADCDGHPQNCCRKNTPKKSQVENALAKRTSRRKTSRFNRLDGGSSAAVGPGQRPSKTAENRPFPSFSWSRKCWRGLSARPPKWFETAGQATRQAALTAPTANGYSLTHGSRHNRGLLITGLRGFGNNGIGGGAGRAGTYKCTARSWQPELSPHGERPQMRLFPLIIPWTQVSLLSPWTAFGL